MQDSSDEEWDESDEDETMSSNTSSVSSRASLSSRDSIMSRLCAQVSDIQLFKKDQDKASQVSSGSSSSTGYKFSPAGRLGYESKTPSPKVIPSYVA